MNPEKNRGPSQSADPALMEELLHHSLVQKVMAKQGWTSYEQIPPDIRQKLEGMVGKLGPRGPASGPNPSSESFQQESQTKQDWSRFSTPSDSPKIPKAAVTIIMVTLFFFILGFLISYFIEHHH